jgi:hypothetical protein
VAVLGHEYVADNPEAQLTPKIIQGLNEFALVAVGVKDAAFSMSVGGQVVEMILTVDMLQTWRGDSLCHSADGRRHEKQCLRHPRSGEATSADTS